MSRQDATFDLDEHGPGYSIRRRRFVDTIRDHVTEIACFRQTATGTLAMRETASLVFPVIFGFEAPFRIGMGRRPGPADHYLSFTGGIFAGPVLIESEDTAECVQINFTPPGIRRFLDIPPDLLADRVEALEALSDRPLASLGRQLGEERDWARRLDLAEAFVRNRLARSEHPLSPVLGAYRAILSRGGDIRVSAIAERIGWSRKHLVSRFHDEIGASPKSIARIARFNRAQSLAATGKGIGWAGIAADCGYSDQAHLVREFRDLAGETPAAWLARLH